MRPSRRILNLHAWCKHSKKSADNFQFRRDVAWVITSCFRCGKELGLHVFTLQCDMITIYHD